MSKLKLYELHSTILNAIIGCYKIERFNIFQRILQSKSDFKMNNIQKEIRAMLQMPLVTKDVSDILGKLVGLQPVEN